MSSSDVRIYRVYKEGEPAVNVEFKGLAQKEKEIVISNLNISEAFQELINEEVSGSEFSRFHFREVDVLTEDELIDYAKSPASLKLFVVKITEDEETVVYDPTDMPDATSIIVTPATATSAQSGTSQFEAQVIPSGADQTVTWTIETGDELTISNDGLVTIGATTAAGDYVVTATSGSITGTATLTVE